MKIAVPYEQGAVGQHFGRTEQFKVYDTENGQIRESRILAANGAGHGALAGLLRAAGAEVLICGGIGMGARAALGEAGIRLFPGVSGDADDAVKQYLAGTLVCDPDSACHHRHGDGGDAACHHGNGGDTACHRGCC